MFLPFSEEAVFRSRQTEIFSQRYPLILASKDLAALQLRHHAFDEIVQSRGKVREHNVETVACIGKQPFLHLVGDLCRSADECQAAKATDALRELPHGQVLASRELNDSLTSTLAGVAFRDWWQRPVRIESGDIVAEHDLQRRDPAVAVHDTIAHHPLP